jgi:hypothetical protein
VTVVTVVLLCVWLASNIASLVLNILIYRRHLRNKP